MFIASAFNAFGLPGIGLMVGQLPFTYYKSEAVPPVPDWEIEARNILLFMICWVIYLSLVHFGEKTLFGMMGEKLTMHLRVSLIEEIMYKQISWFDREDRAPGIITTIVASNIADLNGLTSETIVSIFEVFAIVILGLIGGTVVCWQAAVLCFVLCPIMIIGMYMQTTLQWGNKGGKYGTQM